MDNATHALVGLLLAEAAIQLAPGGDAERGRFFRTAARLSSVVANNVNDLDFLYARRLGEEKLGYLLHHRGHTHTLLFGLACGALIVAAVLLIAKRRGHALTGAQRSALILLGALGPCVHIGFDFLNNYGVHPFWPLDERWFYGDTLFIIEPWLWTLLIPALFFQIESRVGRASLGFVFVAGLALAWSLGLAPWWLAALLSGGGLVCVLWSRRARPRQRLIFASAALAVVLSLFALGSRQARAEVTAALQNEVVTVGGARERLVDAVLTPAPGDPLCFSVVTLHVAGDSYVARAAALTLAPGLVSAEGCRVQPTGLTLGLGAATRRSSPSLLWQGQWTGSLAELTRLRREHCEVAAFLHFARVPFWRSDGAALLIGDLRFDRDPDLDFDELLLRPGVTACPPWVPPWRPPRSELLGER